MPINLFNTSKQDQFKEVFRKRVDVRRMKAICGGDEELARSLIANALREIAAEIEEGN